MKNIISELNGLVTEYVKKISAISDSDFSAKPLPNKWSKKEVVGHLIDSAQNNLRRFIVTQYESQPPNIIYDQDFWVKANAYQQMKKEEVIALWRMMNERICDVLKTMPESNYGRVSNTGQAEIELHTLQWLAEDYIKHMKHHLNQVIPDSFEIIYQ